MSPVIAYEMGRRRYICSVVHTSRHHNTDTRAWKEAFSGNRGRKGTKCDPLWIETPDQLDNQRSLHDAFLCTSEVPGLRWEVERVQKFFREAGSLTEARIWIDIRGQDVKTGCWHSRWITADQLVEATMQQRLDQQMRPIAYRRFSFVPFLSPRTIEKLIKCATPVEIEALREAVCQYFGGDTLLRVHTPTKGFSVFRLIWNLPCLSLEEALEDETNVRPFVDGHNKKRWKSLSQLSIENENGHMSNKFAIYETQTTVVISGYSDVDCFGYALGNVGSVDVTTNEEEQENFSDTNGACRKDEEGELEEDYFATGGCESLFFPDNIMLDPRVYFLRAVQTRLMIATQTHAYLVQKLDTGCPDWMPKSQDNDANQKALEQNIQLMKVFRRVHKYFALSHRAWTRFRDGDARYFADVKSDPIAREAWSSISKSFEKMSDLQFRVKLKMKECTEATNILNAHMTQMSNIIGLGNMNMSRELAKINLKASKHSESAAESASKSLTAAENTSRSSRVNVQLFMLTTAFIIALQYFCSERALFAFERSPQTFWISIAVLVPSLLCLSFALHAFDRVKELVVKRIFGIFDKYATPEDLPMDPAV